MMYCDKQCGIITYHFAANYGAVLQCYALKSCLNHSDIKTSVINYISNSQENNNSLYRRNGGLKSCVKNIALIPFHRMRSRRKNRFDEFVKEYILDGDTARICNLDSLKAEVDDKYFCVISGSDQVFNPKIIDFNTSFFLPFKTKARKVGYAVSTGGASPEELFPFRTYIDDFKYITARENTTINTLSVLTSKDIVEVCDPVFLEEQGRWTKIAQGVKYSDYLVCYFVKSKRLKEKIRIAESIARQKGLKLIILSARVSVNNFGHTVMLDCGPVEFLSFFANSNYICTDSFHGTSFALIFNKEFSTFEDKSESADGRKTSLLKKVGLINRVYYLGDPWRDPGSIKYDDVNKIIDGIRKESKEILINMICDQDNSDI